MIRENWIKIAEDYIHQLNVAAKYSEEHRRDMMPDKREVGKYAEKIVKLQSVIEE